MFPHDIYHTNLFFTFYNISFFLHQHQFVLCLQILFFFNERMKVWPRVLAPPLTGIKVNRTNWRCNRCFNHQLFLLSFLTCFGGVEATSVICSEDRSASAWRAEHTANFWWRWKPPESSSEFRRENDSVFHQLFFKYRWNNEFNEVAAGQKMHIYPPMTHHSFTVVGNCWLLICST